MGVEVQIWMATHSTAAVAMALLEAGEFGGVWYGPLQRRIVLAADGPKLFRSQRCREYTGRQRCTVAQIDSAYLGQLRYLLGVRLDLLVHDHGADLGCDRCACEAGQHDRCDQRAEFTEDRVDLPFLVDRRDSRFQVVPYNPE